MFSLHNKHMEIALIIIISILAFLLLALLAGLITIYFFMYYSPYKSQQDDYHMMSSPQFKEHIEEITGMIDYIKKIPYSDLYIASYDETKLHARFYKSKNNKKKVAILCHGYRGTAYRDFSGGGRAFIELGYNVILIDQRAHGLSKGHSITFGVKESKDLLAWIKYAYGLFGEDIELVLVGISMGGATVLNVANKVNDKVKIIADCPYASIKELLIDGIKKMKLPIWFMYPLLRLSALVFMHVDINKFDNYKVMKETKCPIMIIHGNRDTVVPYTMSYNLSQAYCNKIRYELFDGAEHGVSYIIDKKRYLRITEEFLKSK